MHAVSSSSGSRDTAAPFGRPRRAHATKVPPPAAALSDSPQAMRTIHSPATSASAVLQQMLHSRVAVTRDIAAGWPLSAQRNKSKVLVESASRAEGSPVCSPAAERGSDRQDRRCSCPVPQRRRLRGGQCGRWCCRLRVCKGRGLPKQARASPVQTDELKHVQTGLAASKPHTKTLESDGRSEGIGTRARYSILR